MIPITVRTTEQFLRAVPHIAARRRAGAGREQVADGGDGGDPGRIRGILTGTMLGVARVAGETAPLLFTSFSNRFWSHGLGPAHGLAAGDDLHLRHLAV